MRFDVADRARLYSSLLEGATDHVGLRVWIWHRIGIGASAVIDRTALDDAINMITVSLGLRQWLEQHCANPFSRNVAIATFAKTFAAAFAGRKLPLAKRKVLIRMKCQVYSASNHHRTVALLQRLAAKMQRCQRRRTHRVDSHTRTIQVKKVRNPVGN